MSIANITEKILNEANEISETSLRNAESRSLEILNEAKEKSSEILAEAEVKAKEEAEAIKSRIISAGELQERKIILNAKQEAIKKSFNLALEKLSTMPEDKYINYLIEEIVNINNCKGEIVLNETDKNKIGEKLVEIVNERLNGNKVVLSENSINTKGGFILKNGDIEVNNTFETILSSIKEGLTFEVANTLFK
jgi:V/A-type H+/Na+-transporting ATPase subunit E